MLPVERLDAIIARAEALQEEMNAELPPERFVELSKEYAEIDPLVGAIKTYRAALAEREELAGLVAGCLLYTSPSPRDISGSRMPSSA